VFGFLVGQVMKATRGQANPQLVNQLLRQALTSPAKEEN
jgi:aspartyl-tRNA(Asn)/glutamyl-tRNA(Gln) amidotransferase subunit B